MIDFTHPGRMISPSKTRYHERYPDHVVIFNANVFTAAPVVKIWWGDLDLTLEAAELQQLANERQTEIFVLREIDGRFEKEVDPDLSRAVASFRPLPAID